MAAEVDSIETVVASPTAARERMVWILPAVFTVGWLVYVSTAGQWERVADTWRTAFTMLFGSFVAGSTPQGGGAVAFPVFTKILEITPSAARTFSLSIQATGMVMASATILIAGRKVDGRSIIIGSTSGVLGFLAGAFLLSDPSSLWWDPIIPAAYLKVTFTIAIAGMAYIVFLCFSGGSGGHAGLAGWTLRSVGVMVAFAFAGGMISSLTGSGIDVFLFAFLVFVTGMHPRVGIPTSIITMAVVSVVGFVLFGLIAGQLSIDLNAAGDVVGVGGEALSTPLSGERFDLFGIWLGAMPVVVWGAPFGAWVASVLDERHLIRFVAGMAILEVITTIIFLDALRTNMALTAYFVLGLIGVVIAIRQLGRARTWIMSEGSRV